MDFEKAQELFVSALATKSLTKLRQQLKELRICNERLARKMCLDALCSLTEENDYDQFVREIVEHKIFKPPWNKSLLSVTPTLLYNTAKRCKSTDELKSILSLLASVLDLKEGGILDVLDNDGYSALHLCVLNEDEDAAKVISTLGADCNKKSGSGHTALSLSIAYGNEYFAPLFVFKSDVNTQDSDKDTPIMFAAWNKLPRVMKMLIQYGANVNAVSEHGSSALWNAVYQSSPECVLMLMSQNARMDVKCAGTHIFLNENQSWNNETAVTKLYGQHEQSLLWVAVDRIGINEQSLKVLSIILEAGYDVTKENWLRISTGSKQLDYPKSLKRNQPLQCLLNYLNRNPQNLRDICRNCFRKYYRNKNSTGIPFHDWLNEIGLPRATQDLFTLNYISI